MINGKTFTLLALINFMVGCGSGGSDVTHQNSTVTADSESETMESAKEMQLQFHGTVNKEDLTYEQRFVMVKSGTLGIPLPELEEKEKQGIPLTEEEIEVLNKLKNSKGN